jgi:hypothetical protein
MDDPIPQQESDTQQPGGFLAILYWLIRLLRLTEEEQEEAGIHLDGQHDR